jgi:hypothetical protein
MASMSPSLLPSTSAPSGAPSGSPVRDPVPLQSVNFADLTATVNQTVSFYTAHLEETVDILVFFPPINQSLYIFESEFMEIGSNCSSLSGREIPRSDTKTISLRLSVDTTLAVCSDSAVTAASYHIFANITIADDDVSTVYSVFREGTCAW